MTATAPVVGREHPVERVAGVVLAIILVALTLRTGFGSLPPLLTQIQSELGLSATAAGLLTTIPPLCLGVFAPIAPWLANRLGIAPAIGIALLASLLGTVVRAVDGAPALFLGTILVGAGPAVIGVLLPRIVKERFPRHLGLATAGYTTALVGGAMLGAAATYPVTEHLLGGNWRPGLAIWALPVAAALAAWVARRHGASARAEVDARPSGSLLHDPVAWAVTAFMGLQALYFYATLSWFAAILQSYGVPADKASALLGLSNLVQIPVALAAPLLAGRLRSQSLLAAGTVAFSMVGFVGLLVAPVSHATTWAVLLGVGQGASIAVAMTLIVLRSPDAGTAGRLSGMSQGIGYLLAAAGPLLVGAMRDISGGWQVPLLLLAILTIPGMMAGWVAGHPVMAGTLPSRIPRARARPSRRRN